MLTNMPDIVVSILVGGCAWLVTDKIRGVERVDKELIKKVDRLLEGFFKLEAATNFITKGIEDVRRDLLRLEKRVDDLENSDDKRL